MTESSIPIDLNCPFKGSTLLSFNFEYKSKTLIINLLSWDERIMQINFDETEYFEYASGDYIVEIFHVTLEFHGLNDRMKKFIEISKSNSYKSVIVKDINDVSILSVICKNYAVL